ncbi:MAG: acyl-CoA dehydrogenase family protein, partial [Anaerolineae bacterium]
MDLVLNEEQKMIQDMARDFAQSEIAPIAAEIDESGQFPSRTIKKMGELGFMGIEIPEEYGGTGMDTVSYVLAIIEISKACASHGVIMSVNNSLVCHGILEFGTEEQKQTFLVPLASGEKLGSYSLTEPQAGSDPANMRCTAVYDASTDEYVINGLKAWVTSGPVADFIVLFAMTDKSQGHRGISAFIVDTKLPGFSSGKVEPKLGIRASHTSELVFENYRLPAWYRLGEEGMGFKIALSILDAGRIGIAAQAVGIAEAAYEASRDYAKEREQFGQLISEFQAIQWMLADMKTRIEASRLLTYQAALAKAQAHKSGARYSLEAAMAKVFASETA